MNYKANENYNEMIETLHGWLFLKTILFNKRFKINI